MAGPPIAVVFVLSIPRHSAAMPQDALNPEWVQKDLAGAAVIGKLVPAEKQTIRSIMAILGGGNPDQDDDTGFGGRIFSVRRGHGYTSVTAQGFEVSGRLARLRVSVHSLLGTGKSFANKS